MDLRPLTDDVLLSRLDALVRQERENVADIVEHLAEVDRRELTLDRGFPSLFDYCRRELGYSEAAAFLRIRAARAVEKFPEVLSRLRSGAIHLDTLMRLYPYLDPQNCDVLLDQAAGLSRRQIERLTAQLSGASAPIERDVIRSLPAATAPVAASSEPLTTTEIPDAPASLPAAPPSPAAPMTESPTIETSPAPASSAVPPAILTPSRVRLAFTADDKFLTKVDRLRGFLRHKFPAGRLEDVLGEAVSTLLARLDPGQKEVRRKMEIPPHQKTHPNRRRIPAAIKAVVWERDGGRCAYIAPDGRRCESTEFLEYDHVIPWAVGGLSDMVSNIRLLCRPHNLRLARKRFGPRRRVKIDMRPTVTDCG